MKPSTNALLAELATQGIEVRVENGHIYCRGRTPIPGDLKERIALAKDDLLAPPSSEAANCAATTQGGTDRTDGCPSSGPSGSSGGGAAGVQRKFERPNVCCLSCGGTRFVRLKDGRRSVCFGCERPPADQIVGDDVGFIGGAA